MNAAIIAVCAMAIMVIGCQGVSESGRYIGCYIDRVDRALAFNYLGSATSMKAQLCIQHCRRKGHPYAGVQHGLQCFCGTTYYKHGAAPASQCSTNCAGESTQKCGGPWRNSVYSTGYVGCYKDSVTRAMNRHYYLMPNTIATVDTCIARCRSRGYKYAGAQYYNQCYCDNVYNFYGSASLSQCSTRCRGNSLQRCGGPWKNSVYSTGR